MGQGIESASEQRVLASGGGTRLSGTRDSFGIGDDRPFELPPGADIGGVTIVRYLADGGMGTVYEGRQTAPSRAVAVKVLRAGAASQTLLRRFEHEAQLLARLRHPNIAQVHTLGTFEHEGRTLPFFVMELVDSALPIDRYAEQKSLSVRDRVALMRRVTAAVAHGHRLGIVHRDLKPGNLLVGADGEPKVIDFGVARATDADLAATTLRTDVGAIVGTLQYMSPEQFDADTARISAATDVHALGLVLHELLTGEKPYALRGKPLIVAARIVREEEPRAALRVARSVAASADLDAAAGRQLAAIVEKCLQKQPADRYGDAEALEADLSRWLEGGAVLARPLSPWEQMLRWCHRRRGFVVLACLVAVAGLVAAASSVQARRQERLADALRLAEAREAYVGNVQRAAGSRRNVRHAAALLTRARAAESPLEGRAVEIDCLAARLDDAVETLFHQPQTSRVRAAATVAGGECLVTGDDAGRVRFWSVVPRRACRERHVEHGHDAAIWAAAVSPDGRLAATAAEDGSVVVWDTARGVRSAALEGHGAAVYGLAFAPDGRSLASASADGSIGVWDLATGRRSLTLTPESSATSRDRNIYGVTFSPHAGQLAAACGDGLIRLWSLESGVPPRTFRGHGRRAFSVCFTSDGARLASASEDGTARVWDVDSERERLVLRHPFRVNAVAWTADDAGVVTVSADGVVRRWDAAAGRLDREWVGHRDAVWSVAPLADDRMVTSSSDGTVKVWDVGGTDAAVAVCDAVDVAAGNGVRSVAWSPCGQRAAIAMGNGRLQLWNPGTSRLVHEWPRVAARINSVMFSPSGDRVATACGDGVVRLLAMPGTGGAAGADADAAVREFTATGPVFAIAFSPDGRRIAAASARRASAVDRPRDGGGGVAIWKAASSAESAIMLPHPAAALGVAWSPDAQRIATACADGHVRIWEVTEGRCVGTWAGHTADVNWVAWSPAGELLASCGSEGTVRIWNVGSRRCIAELSEPVGQVWKVAFSPDSTRLAGAGAEGAVHLWHIPAARHLLVLEGHVGNIWGLAFSPGGDRILTGADDGTVRVWGQSAAELESNRRAD